MKINLPPIAALGGLSGVNQIKPAEDKKPTSGKDMVNVSDKAYLFQTLLKKAQETPEIRNELVLSLKEKIADGQFKIEPETIAKKILNP